jgi:hypothetical protein
VAFFVAILFSYFDKYHSEFLKLIARKQSAPLLLSSFIGLSLAMAIYGASQYNGGTICTTLFWLFLPSRL